jgi:hypothetical protein
MAIVKIPRAKVQTFVFLAAFAAACIDVNDVAGRRWALGELARDYLLLSDAANGRSCSRDDGLAAGDHVLAYPHTSMSLRTWCDLLELGVAS